MSIRSRTVAALAAVVAGAACTPADLGQLPVAVPTEPGTVTEVLDRAGIPDYDREQHFGDWTTIDGCTTRQWEIQEASGAMAFDGADKDACLDDGPVVDFWTRKVIQNPDWRYAQVDHVVPLSLFWSGGAYTWTRADRVKAANDRDNLVMTSAEINRDVKNDKGPDEWRPANPAVWCDYRNAWVLTITRYDLSWPEAQETAYETALDDMCPGGAR